MSLFTHEVPEDFASPSTSMRSANGLESEFYRIAWDDLCRPVKAPCWHYSMRGGIKVYVGHFPHPDGGCWYGCEEL